MGYFFLLFLPFLFFFFFAMRTSFRSVDAVVGDHLDAHVNRSVAAPVN